MDGLYNQKYTIRPSRCSVIYFLSARRRTSIAFYRDKILSYAVSAKPNAAHKKLAELEEKGILSAVVTQNIDGLHQAAGSKNVFELHGSVLRNYCTRCGKSYGVDYMIKSEGVPHCSCGGIIKPDVVLYEEALDDRTVRGAVNAIASADTLIIAGTSMVAPPRGGGCELLLDGKASCCDKYIRLRRILAPIC